MKPLWSALHATRVREELTKDEPGSQPPPMAYLRACVLETVRLWPTTLVVLRDSTTATSWRGRIMPGQTSLVIVSSFFHRDPTAVAYADRFVPPIWLDGRGEQQPGFIPFSAGPARCPGENLVLFTASAFLASLMRSTTLRLINPRLDLLALPRTLNPATIRLTMTRRTAP